MTVGSGSEWGAEDSQFPNTSRADHLPGNYSDAADQFPSPPEGCQLCGWQPAAEVSLRRQVGMVVTRRVESLDGRLCKGCGQAAYRSMTNRTLLTGWWSFVGFFANFVHLGKNLLAGRKLSKLDSPRTPPADGEGLLPGPLDPGKPLSTRVGPWLAGLAAVLLIGGGVSAALSSAQRGEGGQISRGGTLDVMELQEGDCFNDPEGGADEVEVLDVQAVVCSETHDNEVFDAGSVPDGDSYPGNDALLDQVASRCLAEFQPFVGLPYQNSVLDFVVLTPTASSWEEGDRGSICAIYDPTGPVEGSLQGANR